MRVPHRRSFLKHTLAAGAAAALLPTTRVLGANDDVRVAVVGLRSQGKSHLRNYLNMQGVRLVALCDVDQAILDAEVSHRSSTVVQLAYIACLLGRKLKWDPVTEECPGDDEANTLVRGQPGLPPWTIP